MRQSILRHRLVEFIPERLDEGVLYVSQQYMTAVHKCCCGCGEEVVTPLGPTDWSLRIAGEAVTLHPSIGNWSFPCRSHYWIRNSSVVWAPSMTRREIERGRTLDRARREAHFAQINAAKETGASNEPARPSPGLLNGILQVLKRL